MRMKALLAFVLITVNPVCASSEILQPTKTVSLKCASYRADASISGAETGTMNVRVDLVKLRLWIGISEYEIISLSQRAIVAMEQMEDGADIIVIQRQNGSFQRSMQFANVYGAHYMSWSGSCSPTPI